MRFHWAVLLIVIPVATLAIGNPSGLVVHEGVKEDLNGDGIEEMLIGIFYDSQAYFGFGSFGFDRFVLDINGVHAATGSGVNLDAKVSVVDIDTTDTFREIAVPEAGPSSDDATQFFYFTGDSIVSVGKIPGKTPKYNGVGEVETNRRERILHTWFYPARYRLNKSHQLELVEEEFYPMGHDVTVLSELPLSVSPTNSSIAVVLHPGQKVTIVGGDDRRWCLVETEAGAQGWFEVEKYSFIVGVGKRASEVFDGLRYAD